ncbi:hypothetical protein GCM10007424_25000 [Flavobacterium suaedae]|uniref:DUF541 domain-containing protein n=1 Tax=Flavobacterium suaedae TaxID=1767027 RepID=A0ABQ1K4P2_9FLAO|nr:SIMPL domain-containing protein [Flavobacterium suaedae]GGB83992.1 hypothetical protein GCM10007424_25000 [Flavobacterium suaedae]
MKIYLQLLIVFIGVSLYAQQQTTLNQPYIETIVEADSLVVPDRIHISVLLNEADFRGRKSVEEQEQLLKQALIKVGVDVEKDVTLLDFGSNYKGYFLKGKDVIKNKLFNVLVRDACTAGKVLVRLEEVGISNVMITKTEYSGAKNLVLQLKGLAVKRAKQQAEALAVPLNQKVGKALLIKCMDRPNYTSSYNAPGTVVLRGVGTINNDTTLNSFDVDFDKIKFVSTVQVVFVLE